MPIKEIVVDFELIEPSLFFNSGIFLNDDLDTPIVSKPAKGIMSVRVPTNQSLAAGETLTLTFETFTSADRPVPIPPQAVEAKVIGVWNSEDITGTGVNK